MSQGLTSQVETRPVYSATDARRDFATLMDEAVHKGPVFVRRRQQEAVLISRESYDRLVALEARLDEQDAARALEDYRQKGGVRMDDLMKELGID
ncbi:type II toxin-antitoxin system Phd/YefM family antitoxin [Alkalicaulis satelles]|nr:type II toxin-antitoxin system Phd/YefM family antitoxin [Alkalicaulis satelles]